LLKTMNTLLINIVTFCNKILQIITIILSIIHQPLDYKTTRSILF